MGSVFAALTAQYIGGIESVIMVSPTHVPFEGTTKNKKNMTGHSVAAWRARDIPFVKPDFGKVKMSKYYRHLAAKYKVMGMWTAFYDAYQDKTAEKEVFLPLAYLSFPIIKMVLLMIGFLLVAVGAALWFLAVFRTKIDDGITNNHLVTDGVYALVRNPIYSAFLSVCTGMLMIYGNLWLLILPVLYWLFLTVLMKCTEEKWLKKR